MRPWEPYKKTLKVVLKDPKMVEAYLNTVLAEGDWDVFLLALRNVAEVHKGGLSKVARSAKLHRVHLYRMLSTSGNPGMRNIFNLLRSMGYQVTLKAPAKLPKAA
jgi:probable addiction module antidote protein